AAVRGFVQAAARPAAGAGPRLEFELPHPSEENARVVGIHGDVGAAGILVDGENLLPVEAAIAGAVDAALGLRPVGVAERAAKDEIGIARVDQNTPDPAGLLQAHKAPGLARVQRFVNAGANGDMAPDE